MAEVFLRCTVAAHASTAHSANLATKLFVDESTETQTHRDEGVSISEDRGAQRLQSNMLEAIAKKNAIPTVVLICISISDVGGQPRRPKRP